MKVLLCLLFFPFWTQSLEISSRVNKNEVALNETFVFKIDIQYEKENLEKVERPDFSQNQNFYLIKQSQSSQTSIQILNGEMSRTNIATTRYTLQPKREGVFKIEPLIVKVNGQVFYTQEFSIKVTKENQKTPSPTPQQKNFPSFMPDPFSTPNSLFDMFTGPFQDVRTEKGDIKLQFQLNKNSFYKGEMIKAEWFVLKSSKSIGYEVYKIPNLSGFWKEELKNKRSKTFKNTEIINKVLYQKTLLDSFWLFPLKEGKLSIDPYAILTFHKFAEFRLRGQGKVKSSPSTAITVKELPTEGLDESWTGAIGIFKVKASLNNQEAKVNQPLSYVISFEGLGHPRFIDLPKLNFPRSVQTYPPVKRSSFSDSGEGKKDFEIIIIPKEEGLLEIPSFKLKTFNPITEQYERQKTPSFSLMVKKGKASLHLGEKFFTKEKESDKTTFLFEPLTKIFWPQFLSHKKLTKFWIFCFAFFLFCILFLFLKRIVRKKEKTFKQKIQKQIKSIEELLKKRDWRKACTQMIHLNYSALYEKQTQDLVSDWRQALENLPPSLNKKYALQFEALLKELESLSFGPKNQNQKEAMAKTQKAFKQTKTLLHSFLLS